MNCRKFSIYRFLDELVWLLVAFGPFILYAIYVSNEAVTDPMPWRDFCMDKMGFLISGSDGVFENAVASMFGSGDGFLDLYDTFSQSLIVDFLIHFFAVQFMHVMFDLLCFIPKWCHEMMHKFAYKGGYDE